MKKLSLLILAGAVMLSLTACTKNGVSPTPQPSNTPTATPGGSPAVTPDITPEPSPEILPDPATDLSGIWIQTNPNSEDTYQMAEITQDAITVYWVSDGGDTKSLYWAGSFVPPTGPVNSYSWDSVNDTEQTSGAMLASTAESKTFEYKNGVLSYEASAFGTTTTVKLERE